MSIPDDLFFEIARGGINPGRDLIDDAAVASRAHDTADMRQNLLVLYALAAGSCAKRILELGTADGTSTLAFLKAACEVDGHVTSVDVDDVPVAEALVDRFGLRSRWTFLRGDSHAVLPALKKDGREFDLILVDGDHSYAGALQDLSDSAAMLKHDGILLFHDSCMAVVDGSRPGCCAAAHMLLCHPKWQGFVMPFGSDLTLFQRRRAGVMRLERALREQSPEIAALADLPPLEVL